MELNITLEYVLAVIAGILILIQPKLLNWIVAIYLIVVGVAGILDLNSGL